MSRAGLSFDEIAARLATAARGELFAINQLEHVCHGDHAPLMLALTVAETRRQAHALGLAHKITLALAARPDLAPGLGLNGQDFADLVALDGADDGSADANE